MVTLLRRHAVRLSLMLLVLLGGAPALGAVSAQLSAQNIDELEAVRLSIKITETRQSQTLDLSELEQDFHVLNTNTVSQSRFLNGRGHSWVDYQITLQPKRTGTITIPSIEVNGERTPTLELRVRPLSTQTRQLIDELVFFENAVSANSVYVQSQLVLTRRLFYSQGVQLYSDLPGAPKIKDAVVLTLGETRSASIERDGRPYGVVEQQYAVFPERSGSFTIPSISITASVRLIEGDRVSRKGVRVGTEDVTIEVLPVPAEYPADKPWLPAENVTLFDVINPELSSYQVGDTLSHELLIHVEGNIGTIAPPVTLEADEDNFRVYPQAPEIQDDTAGGTVKGSRLQTHSLVPLNPGSLELPGSELVWWDTVNRRVRLSATKPRSLRIQGEAVQPATADGSQAQTAETAAVSAEQAAAGWELSWRSTLPYLLGALAFFALVGLAWGLRQWLPAVEARVARARGAGSAGSSSTRRAARKALTEAFRGGRDAEIHQQLLTYLSLVYDMPAHQALQRLRGVSAEVGAAVDALLAGVYGSGSSMSADQHACLQQAALQAEAKPRRTAANPLPELYPQTS